MYGIEAMHWARVYHGVTALGNYIYVAGGFDDLSEVVKKCERFDLQKKVWVELDNADFDDFGEGVTLMSAKSRYVIAVGGANVFNEFPDAERIARLDTLKLHKGWQKLNLAI